MTIKEATTKVCPFMSQVNHVVTWNNNGYNHDIKLNKATFDAQNCIGDKCMAWISDKEVLDKRSFFAGKYPSLEMFYDNEDLDSFEVEGTTTTGKRKWVTFVKYNKDCGHCARLPHE